MGPEEERRAAIKQAGKLQTTKGLPLFKRRKVTRDTAPKEIA